jgi:cyclohexa-1,5-dienecarbonyl-CoA hydratase
VSGQVRLTVADRVARITFERPPLNVLNTAMMQEMAAQLERVATQSDVRIVRVDSAGKLFCAGVDVVDHEGALLPPMLAALARLFEAFEKLPQPSVAVVHGPALGGGCEVALATDLCLASERATFGQPEIKLGVFAPPASVLLPRLIGERKALGLLLSGEAIGAAEAQQQGLVTQLFPDAGFEDAVSAWIARVASYSGVALRLAKRAVTATRGLSVADAQRAALRIYSEELMRSEDASEGLRAFLEKRAPRWSDR